MINKLINDARKIVVKIGSATLANNDGRVNMVFMTEFADQVADLMKNGKQLVIVSSGAQVAGLSSIGKWTKKKHIHYKQALCAIGQVELMDAWKQAFWARGIHIGQLLLTKADFSDNNRALNIRNTLFTLVDEAVVPIINENDSVCVEEIKIGDNDNLAALSATLWSADLLILLSDIDGVYDKNPKTHADAKLVTEVSDIAALKASISMDGVNGFGTGGMVTKLEAAAHAGSFGVTMVLTNGGKPRILEALAAGRQAGTIFWPSKATQS